MRSELARLLDSSESVASPSNDVVKNWYGYLGLCDIEVTASLCIWIDSLKFIILSLSWGSLYSSNGSWYLGTLSSVIITFPSSQPAKTFTTLPYGFSFADSTMYASESPVSGIIGMISAQRHPLSSSISSMLDSLKALLSMVLLVIISIQTEWLIHLKYPFCSEPL